MFLLPDIQGFMQDQIFASQLFFAMLSYFLYAITQQQ